VEDWNEGEKVVNIEDRGLGLVTREVWFETKKTPIAAGKTKLIPWKDIPAVGPEVSGLGTYTVKAAVPAAFDPAKHGAELLIGSTNGNSAAVTVNGKAAPPYDFNARSVEIGPLLRPGENTITVEVSSTLNNRVLARNYPQTQKDFFKEMMAHFAEEGGGPPGPEPGDDGEPPPGPPPMDGIKMPVRDYGMTGEVSIRFYGKAG